MFLLNLGLVLVSAYAGFFNYESIIHAQHYETRTERAAKYSSTADEQLWQSRKTLGSGAVACALSLLSGVHALFANGSPSARRILFYALNVALCLGSRQLIGDFWGQKSKVPRLKHFNQAITSTDKLRVWLMVLAGLWGLTCACGAIGL